MLYPNELRALEVPLSGVFLHDGCVGTVPDRRILTNASVRRGPARGASTRRTALP